MKRDHWHQANPKDQLRVMHWALEGDLDFMKDLAKILRIAARGVEVGMSRCDRLDGMIRRMSSTLEQAKEIAMYYMPESGWEDELPVPLVCEQITDEDIISVEVLPCR